MNNTLSWRKRISILLNRLYLYPAPEPMPRTRLFWLATALVALAVLLFSGFYIAYLTGLHDAYRTHAEDLGIMDQAIWNTLHGQVLHQTICNNISDTNCYSLNGISRFSIHFEPILFLIALFYLIAPDPKTLLIIQTLVVASGAFPAFWLARLRLRNELAAVAIALLYLLYPALQQAVVFDFHAVTLTAAFVMFLLYFMYTRRTVWAIVFAVLAMACKEELWVIMIVYGLWSIVFQRRYRTSLLIIGIALLWFGLWQAVVHYYAGGRLLLASRYTYLGKGPLQIVYTLLRHPKATIQNYILEYRHLAYLRTLFAPTGFLAVLAPWVLILALPTLALNMLSSDSQMYSGMFQYNAEIVPVLIFATIEAFVLIVWLVQLLLARIRLRTQNRATQSEGVGSEAVLATRTARSWRPLQLAHIGLLALLSLYILVSAVRIDYLRGGSMPFSVGFQWPQTTAHEALAQRFVDMIPPDASVSAQSSLVPHISHRPTIYLFPYGDKSADYIFLDVTSDVYPYYSTYFYLYEAKALLLDGKHGIVAAQDGYLLLKKGLPPPDVSPYSLAHPLSNDSAYVLPNLPESFCSYVTASPQQVTHPVQVNFTSPSDTMMSMDLIGYDVNANAPDESVPSPMSVSANTLIVTTYWRVNTPISAPLQPLIVMIDKSGHEYLGSPDFQSVYWCQTNAWKPGMVMKLVSRAFSLQSTDTPNGLVHVAVALVPVLQASSTIMDVRLRFPLQVVNAAGLVSATNGTNAVELMPITTVP